MKTNRIKWDDTMIYFKNPRHYPKIKKIGAGGAFMVKSQLFLRDSDLVSDNDTPDEPAEKDEVIVAGIEFPNNDNILKDKKLKLYEDLEEDEEDFIILDDSLVDLNNVMD